MSHCGGSRWVTCGRALGVGLLRNGRAPTETGRVLFLYYYGYILMCRGMFSVIRVPETVITGGVSSEITLAAAGRASLALTTHA